jgi:hypothetical protein
MPTKRRHSTKNEVSDGLEKTFPTIAYWINSRGWIEIGRVDYSRSMARVLDEGGMVWEGKTEYATLDELLHDVEAGLAEWLEENG